MLSIAIGLLWVAVVAIVVALVIFVGLRLVRRFFTGMPAEIDNAVWAIFGLLVLIYILMAFAGSVQFPHPATFR